MIVHPQYNKNKKEKNRKDLHLQNLTNNIFLKKTRKT